MLDEPTGVTRERLLATLDAITPGRWNDKLEGGPGSRRSKAPESLEHLSEAQVTAGKLVTGEWIAPGEVGPQLLENAIHGWASDHYYSHTVGCVSTKALWREGHLFDYLIERIAELCADDPEQVRIIGEALINLSQNLPPKAPWVEPCDRSASMPEILAGLEKLEGVDPDHLQALREHVAHLNRVTAKANANVGV